MGDICMRGQDSQERFLLERRQSRSTEVAQIQRVHVEGELSLSTDSTVMSLLRAPPLRSPARV